MTYPYTLLVFAEVWTEDIIHNLESSGLRVMHTTGKIRGVTVHNSDERTFLQQQTTMEILPTVCISTPVADPLE